MFVAGALLGAGGLVDSVLTTTLFGVVIVKTGEYFGFGNTQEISSPSHKIVPETQKKILEEDECVICMDSKGNLAYIPCGHMGFCEKCIKTTEICPFCRSKPELIAEIFDMRL